MFTMQKTYEGFVYSLEDSWIICLQW